MRNNCLRITQTGAGREWASAFLTATYCLGGWRQKSGGGALGPTPGNTDVLLINLLMTHNDLCGQCAAVALSVYNESFFVFCVKLTPVLSRVQEHTVSSSSLNSPRACCIFSCAVLATQNHRDGWGLREPAPWSDMVRMESR